MSAVVRRFDTGATRDLDDSKLDFEGFLSPLVLRRYAEYMHDNRRLRDGSLRDSDNWQQGIPFDAYMKSGYRHFFDWWCEHRGVRTKEGIELALCGLIFNAMGYLHEHLRADPVIPPAADPVGNAHHAHEAPMPPHITEVIARHEDDDTPEAGLNFDKPNYPATDTGD